MQGLNNGYAQLVEGRLNTGGGKDEAAVYTINHLLFTTKLQKLQHLTIEKISQ